MRTRDDALRSAGPAPAAADDVVRWREIVHVAVEAADVAVWELDVAERRLRGSPNLYRLFGLDDVPAAWTVADLEQQVFVDDLPLLRDAIARAADTGDLLCELRVRRKEGRIGWVLLRGRAIGQANGGPSRLAGVAQDVSQRRSSEAFLGDRDAQFSAMFDITSVGMAQADTLSGRLLRVNSRLCAMLNLHAHELVGRRWAMLTHPDDRQSLAASFQQLMHGHIPTFEVEKRLLRKGGGEVWVLMTVNLIRDNAGQPQRTVAVVLDVTERKLAEQALREREDELRQARDDLEERVEERTAELAEANTALVVGIAERRLAEQHVRELLGRQADAVENERRRISREPHDTLGQHLAVLAIELNSIADRDSLPVSPRIAKIRRAGGLIEDELDRQSFELRPRALDELGLEEALRSHVEAWGAESGPHIELHSHR